MTGALAERIEAAERAYQRHEGRIRRLRSNAVHHNEDGSWRL